MQFFLKYKILSVILALCLIGGVAGPLTDSDTPSEPTSAQTESVALSAEDEQTSAPEEEPSSQAEQEVKPPLQAPAVSLSNISAYNGSAYVAINNNVPYITSDDCTTSSFEEYSPLDNLGRCGVAYACVGLATMPTEERGSIGQVKPSGWHTVRYNGVVDGNYLYNRCHLIGYQLTAENANTRNLITGTRYLNTEGMLPFENMVADYIKETGNHVMYRVTPIFDGNDLVASGVLMEAYSVEDSGSGISYCVYCYNVQPGININYADGSSSLQEGYSSNSSSSSSSVSNSSYSSSSDSYSSSSSGSTTSSDAASSTASQQQTQSSVPQSAEYILNENTKKFHYPSCHSVRQMKNPVAYNGSRDSLLSQGYEPCKNCNP